MKHVRDELARHRVLRGDEDAGAAVIGRENGHGSALREITYIRCPRAGLT
jgi:hypothetical protein